jgi:universal stress protein A
MTTTKPQTSRRRAQPRATKVRPLSQPTWIQHILVPIDFSQTSHQALDFALPLAEQFRARISLVHVIEPIIYPQEIGPIAISETRLADSAIKELTSLAHETIPAARLNKVLTRAGQAFREIADAARELKVDLIVITTHGHTGLTRVLVGSTAERIVRHAHCAVLTVRSSTATQPPR